jgi:hypothetical protein
MMVGRVEGKVLRGLIDGEIFASSELPSISARPGQEHETLCPRR